MVGCEMQPMIKSYVFSASFVFLSFLDSIVFAPLQLLIYPYQELCRYCKSNVSRTYKMREYFNVYTRPVTVPRGTAVGVVWWEWLGGSGLVGVAW